MVTLKWPASGAAGGYKKGLFTFEYRNEKAHSGSTSWVCDPVKDLVKVTTWYTPVITVPDKISPFCLRGATNPWFRESASLHHEPGSIKYLGKALKNIKNVSGEFQLLPRWWFSLYVVIINGRYFCVIIINQYPVRKRTDSKVKLKTKPIFLPLFPGWLFWHGLKKSPSGASATVIMWSDSLGNPSAQTRGGMRVLGEGLVPSEDIV